MNERPLASESTYTEALRWTGSQGVALSRGVRVELRSAPVLCGLLGIHRIDFTPALHVALIQPRTVDARRDMTAAEIEAARELLANMAAMARGALSQGA